MPPSYCPDASDGPVPLSFVHGAARCRPVKHRTPRRPPAGRAHLGEPRRAAVPRGDGSGRVRRPPVPGTPTPEDDDAYAGEWAMAFRMLRNAGAAPPWIEADKEVRRLLGQRDALFARVAASPTSRPAASRSDREALERLVRQVNAAIARLNAEAPTDRQHRRPLDLAAELDRRLHRRRRRAPLATSPVLALIAAYRASPRAAVAGGYGDRHDLRSPERHTARGFVPRDDRRLLGAEHVAERRWSLEAGRGRSTAARFRSPCVARPFSNALNTTPKALITPSSRLTTGWLRSSGTASAGSPRARATVSLASSTWPGTEACTPFSSIRSCRDRTADEGSRRGSSPWPWSALPKRVVNGCTSTGTRTCATSTWTPAGSSPRRPG